MSSHVTKPHCRKSHVMTQIVKESLVYQGLNFETLVVKNWGSVPGKIRPFYVKIFVVLSVSFRNIGSLVNK